MSLLVEWEPETQALINAAELEVRPADINIAVRQWLRQILRHRRYLEKLKSDPARREEFKAKAKAYGQQYHKHGPKRDRKKERKETGKIFAEGYAERVKRCLQEDSKKASRDEVDIMKGAI